MGTRTTEQRTGMTSGYSGTPLAKKLGYKTGFNARLINAPEHYFDLMSGVPEGVDFTDDTATKKDLIHFFTNDAVELVQIMDSIREEIKQNGMIWVSWPKKSSGVPTDVTGDVVRNHALKIRLVDVKVCSVDETWSGLKLMIRKEDRI